MANREEKVVAAQTEGSRLIEACLATVGVSVRPMAPCQDDTRLAPPNKRIETDAQGGERRGRTLIRENEGVAP